MRNLTLALLLLTPLAAAAQQSKDIVPLWPDGAPGALGTEPADTPGVWVYPATKNKRLTSVVICPGGGYRIHAVDHEGHQIAKWFNLSLIHI